MKLERLSYDAGALLGFYEQALGTLGALCERTWHDRLEIVAEGEPARLWNADGVMHEVELTFAPADATAARDAGHEVFPGCPLTFRLAEMMCPLALERVFIRGEDRVHAPDLAVAEKLWRAQFPDTARWRLNGSFKETAHFSLVALV